MMALMNPRTSAATASVPYESTCTPGRILEQTNSASAVLIQCTRNRPMVSFPPSALRLSEECLTSGPRPPNGTDPRQRPSVRQVGVDIDRRRLVRGVIEKDPIAREAEREPLLSGRERKGRAGDGRRLDLDRELHQSFLLERPGHRLFIRDEQHADGPGVDGPRARLAAQAHDDGRESVRREGAGLDEAGRLFRADRPPPNVLPARHGRGAGPPPRRDAPEHLLPLGGGPGGGVLSPLPRA